MTTGPHRGIARGFAEQRALFVRSLRLSVAAFVGSGLLVMLSGTLLLITAWVGIPLTLGVLAAVRRLADRQRALAAETLGEPIASPYRPDSAHGLMARVRSVLTDPATPREFAWLWVNGTPGLALALLPLALWLTALFHFVLPLLWAFFPSLREGLNYAGPWVDGRTPVGYVLVPILGVVTIVLTLRWTRPILLAHARLTRRCLAPSPRSLLASRVQQLTQSRAEAVAAQAAEIQRIERDLHDGAQARLVAMGMNLGMAESLVINDPPAAQRLLAEARQANLQALAELRDLVRGIHPPVLADRGLEGAVRALALAAPMPVEVNVALPGRAAAPVESAAYFAVAESLANVIKHSAATQAWIHIAHADDRLRLVVGDNGVGGADPRGGSGLLGVQRRLAAFDGTMNLHSPPGGATILTMELACELSSPKTSPS